MMRAYDAGFRVPGSGLGAQTLGCRVQGSGSRIQGSGFRVQGSGFRVQGFRVQGSGSRVSGYRGRLQHRGEARSLSCTYPEDVEPSTHSIGWPGKMTGSVSNKGITKMLGTNLSRP